MSDGNRAGGASVDALRRGREFIEQTRSGLRVRGHASFRFERDQYLTDGPPHQNRQGIEGVEFRPCELNVVLANEIAKGHAPTCRGRVVARQADHQVEILLTAGNEVRHLMIDAEPDGIARGVTAEKRTG